MAASELSVVLQQSLFAVLAVAGPILVATLVVGLAISVLQAATQINEATLTFVPKLLVVAAILIVMGPGMIEHLLTFTRLVFQSASEVAR
jgi:flagellar biosynthesis protein FliQ